MKYTVKIIPYLYGKYFGDQMESWLTDNLDEDVYYIIPLTRSQFVSSAPNELEVVFKDEVDAVAFKLRWI